MVSENELYAVDGYLVRYDSDFNRENSLMEGYELEIIPEIFELFVLKNPGNYFGSGWFNIQWKETLTFDEEFCFRDFTRNNFITSSLCDAYRNFESLIFQIGLDKFVKKYNSLPPEQIQEARKYYVLDSDGVSPAPMAAPGAVSVSSLSLARSEKQTVPAVPVVVPADSVPAFIQGEVAGIQGSVADVKRDTTLTENKKQTGIQEQMLEEMKKQTVIQERTADLLEQRIKPNTDLREREAAFKQLQNNFPKIMERRAEFWFQFCRPKGEGWKSVYEAENGRRCDLTGEDLESERNNYEKSIRAFRRTEYDDFKRQKKEG